MRFFILAVAAITSAAVTARPEPPRPVVILVHGRGQLGHDTAQLRREWKTDLDSALRQLSLPALQNDDVRLAWYADALDPESDDACGSQSDTSAIGFGGLAGGFLAMLGASIADSVTDDVRGLLGDVLFVVDRDKRCAAERRVASEVTRAQQQGRPVILVAYSLGSIVAYEYARSTLGADSPSIDLITIGSPLGIRTVREVLDEPVDSVTFPHAVANWVNIYNPNDPFAAAIGPALGGHAGSRLTDRRVGGENAEADGHDVHAYLRNRATGEALASALCRATGNRFDPGCRGLASAR